MSNKNNADEPQAIAHGDALPLLPVEELETSVVQDRNALRQLEHLDDESILVIGPDGMASGYKLAQHPLTLVERRWRTRRPHRSMSSPTCRSG